MLLLPFQAGSRRFALPVDQIHRVIQRVPLAPLAGAPPWLAGLLNHHGRPLPVLDLCRLWGEAPCPERLSSRIMLVEYPLPEGGNRLLGLLAERVLAVVADGDETPFQPTGVRQDAPGLDGVKSLDGHLHQRVVVAELLPAAVRERLFPPPPAENASG